jgi:phage shock protein C
MTIFCPKCGAANEDMAQFCASCGEDISQVREQKAKGKKTTSNDGPTTDSKGKELPPKGYRSRKNKMLAGVSGYIARELNTDIDTARLLWVALLIITGGTAIVAYLVMALAIPLEPPTNPEK